jgi:hypothetical protein
MAATKCIFRNIVLPIFHVTKHIFIANYIFLNIFLPMFKYFSEYIQGSHEEELEYGHCFLAALIIILLLEECGIGPTSGKWNCQEMIEESFEREENLWEKERNRMIGEPTEKENNLRAKDKIRMMHKLRKAQLKALRKEKFKKRMLLKLQQEIRYNIVDVLGNERRELGEAENRELWSQD